MRHEISAPVRRIAAVGLLLALIAALAAAAGAVLQQVAAADAALEERRERLGQLIAVARAAPEASRAEADRAAAAALWLEGETDAIRLAGLQATVRQVVEASGARLRSIQTLAEATKGELTVTGVRLVVETDIDGLQRLLLGIEGRRPMLIVDGLDVAPRDGGEGRGRELQADLRVLALVRPAKGAAP